MKINDDTIHYLEELTKIKLNNKETEKMKQELTEILSYMECVSKAGKELPVTAESERKEALLREDVVLESAKRDELLMNTSHCRDGSIIIPKTV